MKKQNETTPTITRREMTFSEAIAILEKNKKTDWRCRAALEELHEALEANTLKNANSENYAEWYRKNNQCFYALRKHDALRIKPGVCPKWPCSYSHRQMCNTKYIVPPPYCPPPKNGESEGS